MQTEIKKFIRICHRCEKTFKTSSKWGRICDKCNKREDKK